jgi:mono/diheme cytochrome c family protein
MLGISGPTYTTDKSGNFTIDNADLGESRIYMIDAAGFAPTGGTVAAGDNTFTLRLPTKLTGKVVDPKGQPVVGAVVFATYATVSDAQISNSPSQHFSSFAIQPFADRYTVKTDSTGTWDLGSIVSARTGSDPLGVASWALVPIKRMSDNSGRALTAMEIGLAAAPYDRAAAQPYYDIATQYVHFDHFNEDSIMSAMRLTALAYALHRPEADSDYAKVSAWLDDLVKSAKNEPNTSSSADWLPRNLVMILALGSVDKALAMLETQPINSRYNTASEIISELVKPNPAGALAVYHWVKQQAASPASERAAERALRLVLPIIYKTDPKGAILQAHSIMDPNTQAQALTDLADQMPPAAAAPLYQEAENKAEGRYGYSPACIACHAWQRDQVLGAKLFNIAYTKFITTSGSMQLPFGQGPSYSDFAFYYSHIDTALSRILIEEQFTKDSMGHGQYYHGDSIQSDVAAMCAIDINRADEMAGTIKDQERRFLAGLKPAQYLLLTPQQRSAVPFSQWSNRSQWTPGTPLN